MNGKQLSELIEGSMNHSWCFLVWPTVWPPSRLWWTGFLKTSSPKVCLDDILIFMKTLDEHQKVVCQVMELLQQHGLSLKPEKCEFKKTSIEYLRVIVSQDSVKMDPAKVAGVAEWSIPSNKKEVWGLCTPPLFLVGLQPDWDWKFNIFFWLIISEILWLNSGVNSSKCPHWTMSLQQTIHRLSTNCPVDNQWLGIINIQNFD